MSRDYLESILKDIYKAENDRADKLDSSLNLPAAVVTVLLGVGAFFIEKMPEFKWNCLTVAFYSTTFTYMAFLTYAIYCLVKSHTNNLYGLTANPRTIAEFERSVREHYQFGRDDKDGVDEDVKRELQETLIDQYIAASELNRTSNLKRTDWLHNAHRQIIRAIGLMVLAKLLFYTLEHPSPKPQEVAIVSVPQFYDAVEVSPTKGPRNSKGSGPSSPAAEQAELQSTQSPPISQSE